MSDAQRDFSVTTGEEIASESRCFVCGLGNTGGLRVRFFRQSENSAAAECTPVDTFMGYHGLLHGGVTATLLDEVMIKALLGQGRVTVTARMSVSYHRPVPLGRLLRLRGRMTRRRGRMVETEGVMEDESGQCLASATGTYVELTGAWREELMERIGS